MQNFSAIAREFANRQAAIALHHANELPFTIERLLNAPDEQTRLAKTARILADEKHHVLDEIIQALGPWLGAADARAA